MTQPQPEPAWHAPQRGEHLLSFAATQAERQAVLATWALESLVEGARFVYAEPEDRATSRSLIALLSSQHFDAQAATADGRLMRIPMAEFYSPSAPELITARAQADGFSTVRVATLASDAMDRLGRDSLLAYEGELAQACHNRLFSSLCQYDPMSAGEWVTKLSGLHHVSGASAPFFAVPGPGAVLLFGEVDASNGELLRAALDEACQEATDVLQVDLEGIELFSSAGCRALLAGTEDFRSRGGELVLLGQRTIVGRVLELMQIARAPGIRVIDGAS